MKTLNLSALVLSLSLTLPAFATHNHGHCTHNCQCPEMQHVLSHIKLTDAEKANINQIKSQGKAALKRSYEHMRLIDKKISELEHMHPINERKLNALLQERAAVMTEEMKTRIQIRHMIYNSLTPEQQQEFRREFKKIEASKKHHHKHHQHPTKQS